MTFISNVTFLESLTLRKVYKMSQNTSLIIIIL